MALPAYDISALSFLILEDNLLSQRLVKSILHSFRLREMHMVEDGVPGMRLLEHTDVDIILCDFDMNLMNGIEFIKSVRHSENDKIKVIPIIMLTGYTEHHRVVNALNSGVNEFLTKPVVPLTLYKRIVSIIDHPRTFIKSDNFMGPDRRRRKAAYSGEERRGVAREPEPQEAEEAELANSGMGTD